MAITSEQLRSKFHYDPTTGHFTRLASTPRWPAGTRAGSPANYGYWTIRIDGKPYLAHRLAHLYMTGDWPPHDMDHINGARADNRWANLRAVSRAVNLQNKRQAYSNSQSGLLGVHPHLGGKRWRARLTVDGKTHEGGCHSTPEQAHAAYLALKRQFHIGCTI